MRKVLFLILIVLLPMAVCSQSQFLGFTFTKSSLLAWGANRMVITSVTPHFPAARAGLRLNDIIESINGKKTSEMQLNEMNDYLSGSIGTPVVLEVKSVGDVVSRRVELIRQSPLPSNSFSEGRIHSNIPSISKNTDAKVLAVSVNPYNVSTIRDPEANFEDYTTFDFELTNAENPIQEKQMAAKLQLFLEQKGLKRNKENPDLLVFIYTYSGSKSQYIPPTQQITTRYKFGYDIWSGWGNRQFIESHQVGGYTDVTYYATLRVAIMDAQKAKQQVKVPPIIWQSEFAQSGANQINLSAVANVIFAAMIQGDYPVNNSYSINYTDIVNSDEGNGAASYLYTGLCYYINEPNKVAYVYPESPAEKAGIQIGDKIISVNNRFLPTTDNEFERYIYQVKLLKESKKDASNLNDSKYKSGFSYIVENFSSDLQQNKVLQFQVSRNGNIQTYYVSAQSWIYESNEPLIYKVKNTDAEVSDKHSIIGGIGYLTSNNTQHILNQLDKHPIKIYLIGGDGVINKYWRWYWDLFDITLCNTGLYNGYKSFYFGMDESGGVGFRLFPSFYLTAGAAVGWIMFDVNDGKADDDETALSKEYFNLTASFGAEWVIARRVMLIARKNIGINHVNELEFGLKWTY